MGCNGGQPGMAWKFFKSDGVVTGGDYSDIDAGSTCLPYQFESCAHHVDDPSRRSCDETTAGKAQKCGAGCSEGTYATDYKSDKFYADSAYSLSGVEAIQRDIMTYGPVSGAFTVYADFPAYKSGVYHHVSGSQLGGHAIKIMGWGTENGEDYWLVMNSWNEMWGDNGTFKIRRGHDECGIESMGVNGGKVTYQARA
jgi:cathepsin B